VHTTQFAIREVGLLEPVLALAAEESKGVLRIAGACGPTAQAVKEAELAASLNYDAVLLSLAALKTASVDELIDHARAVASVMPVFGFYLQPAVGGRILPYSFWRRFAEIENVVAIKMAPFNRYQTLDVVRAVAESGRSADIALYTGNDDNILADLITSFEFPGCSPVRITGGLLGQWAVWTKRAVELLAQARSDDAAEILTLNVHLTDANAALFDVAHNFHGCIAGIHEVLRRQGLLEGIWCLDPRESLSPGQAEEIDRVTRMYPHLTDDAFVKEHLDEWLRG
jgi:dihydrodipicolinate synthase/N-acetylneuraminate lyase